MSNVSTLKYEALPMQGMQFSRVERVGDEIVFESETHKYTMIYEQDCCASCTIKQIDGDLFDLVGHPLVVAEVAYTESEAKYGSETYSFYRFRCLGGDVTIQWFGESNGYYNEQASVIGGPKGEE